MPPQGADFSGLGVQVLNREDGYSQGMARPGHRSVTFGLDAPGKAGGDYGLREGADGPFPRLARNRGP